MRFWSNEEALVIPLVRTIKDFLHSGFLPTQELLMQREIPRRQQQEGAGAETDGLLNRENTSFLGLRPGSLLLRNSLIFTTENRLGTQLGFLHF